MKNSQTGLVSPWVVISVFLVVVIGSCLIYSARKNKKILPVPGSSITSTYGEPIKTYTVEGGRVYYRGNLMNADSKTLEILKGSLQSMKGDIVYLYARDIKSVYYDGKLVVDAILATFRPIENGAGSHNYGTDGKSVYFGSELIPKADPKYFKILWHPIYEGCGQTKYSSDLNHVYFATTTVTNANQATFEALINGFGKDVRGYYKGAVFIGPQIDPKLLVCDYG